MSRVRVYGCAVGDGSFARVTRGMLEGLSAHGALAGFVPVDDHDPDETYDGATAPIGVFVGPPTRVAMMASFGEHAERWALLPPNSSWVPEELLRSMQPYVTGLIAPSHWARLVLQRHVAALGGPELGVSLWPHGVSADFVSEPDANKRLRARYDEGGFEIVHLASTTRQRKGTAELLRAYGAAAEEGKLGPSPVLRLLIEGPTEALQEVAAEATHRAPAVLASIAWVGRRNLDASRASALYRAHHVVCQPSRGEGFGMVPLEARASGAVVVATASTGHAEHMPKDASWPRIEGGVVIVPSGPPAPIDDGPDAYAPEVTVDAVYRSLVLAHENWRELAAAAMAEASSVGTAWSWGRVTRDWLKERG